MKLQKYWYLGFLGLIGIYHLPALMATFQGDGSWWGMTNALWFLWFVNFIPERRNRDNT